MKLIVNIKNYTPFKYSPYLERGIEAKAPENPKYVVGQVVAVKREDSKNKEDMELAVVLGCIDEEFDGELRLDLCGMTSIDNIRPAVVTDFGKSWVKSRDRIYKECQGYEVSYNWDTNEETIEEPTFKY